MSHFTTITTQIKDIEALKAACGELGLTLRQDVEARGYGNNRHQGDYVIVLKGPYDIAVKRQPDGSCGLTTDWWDGHVEREVGANYGKLLQLYGVWKTAMEATRKGYMVTRQGLKNGSIKVLLSGGPRQ
ncbi:MAG: DUF1257 domain-containing protein [bacterium]